MANNRTVGFIIGAVFIIMAVLVAIFNAFLGATSEKPVRLPAGEIPTSTGEDAVPNISSQSPGEAGSEKTLPGEATCKTMVIRGGDITEDIFMRDGQEIAHRTTYRDGKVEMTGKIPDGNVKFTDEYNKTYGTDNYMGGKKFGYEKTFYADGHPKTESMYQFGRLTEGKEFYSDGALRFEVNYKDALELKDTKEVGVGKLYYRDGKIKYEWNMTKSNDKNFKRSYFTDGNLRAETIFDSSGQVLENHVYQGVTDASQNAP